MIWHVLPGVWEAQDSQERLWLRTGREAGESNRDEARRLQGIPWAREPARGGLGTSLKGAQVKDKNSLPHQSPLQSSSEGISKKAIDAPTESKRKSWISFKLRGQNHSTSPFLLFFSPSWDHFWEGQKQQLLMGEELVSKKQPASPSPTTSSRPRVLGWDGQRC